MATSTKPDYVLGHSEHEIARLEAQARLLAPITRRFFCEAGIGLGMRVLDVGSGAGDVAFLAAELVGTEGQVVGTDSAQAAIEVARSRASDGVLRNVEFRLGDPTEMRFDGPFDAVIGRYVLQFQPNAAAMLRRLVKHVRSGGLVCFHEIDWTGVGAFPPVSTLDQCCRWGREALRHGGAETNMGTKLHAAFVQAGLPPPTMRLEALIGGIPTILPWLNMFKNLMATLLPAMQQARIATSEDVGVDTLVERIVAEASAGNSTLLGHFQIGAWARV